MSHLSTQDLIDSLSRGAVAFEKVMQTIDAEYEFTPTRFTNGDAVNESGTNNGSCKIFAFAKLNGLDEQMTLNAFGDYYMVDVLQHPDNQDHQNIRNFMQTGWNGIEFDGVALVKKA